MSQESEILKWLLRGYCITPMDALRLFGCFRLASRINSLRKYGYNIKTEMIEDDDTGKRYAEYFIMPKDLERERRRNENKNKRT